MSGLGIPGTFFLFSGITFAGGFIFICFMKEAQGATPEQLKTLFIPLDKQSDEDNFETTNDIAYGITNTSV